MRTYTTHIEWGDYTVLPGMKLMNTHLSVFASHIIARMHAFVPLI